MPSSHHFHAHFPHVFHWTGHWPVTIAIGTAIACVAVVTTLTIRIMRPALAGPVTAHGPTRSSPQSSARPSPAAPAANPQSGGAGQEQRSVRDIDFGDVRWVSLQGFEVPVSAQAGPRSAADGVAYGFADTAAGAVLAAANIVTRSSWECGPGVFGPTIEKQVTGTDAMDLLENTGASGAPVLWRRRGSADANAALSRQGRYKDVAQNLKVKEVRIAEDERFVICFNPEAAERDAAIRAKQVLPACDRILHGPPGLAVTANV